MRNFFIFDLCNSLIFIMCICWEKLVLFLVLHWGRMSQSGANYKSASPAGQPNSGESQRLLGDRNHPTNGVIIRTNNGNYIAKFNNLYIKLIKDGMCAWAFQCRYIYIYWYYFTLCFFIYLIGLNCPDRLCSIYDTWP